MNDSPFKKTVRDTLRFRQMVLLFPAPLIKCPIYYVIQRGNWCAHKFCEESDYARY